MRDPAQHTCPWLNKIPFCAPSNALSNGISSKKIFADLPPNSKVAGINISAAAIPIRRPTSVEPVKANLLNPL